MKLLAAMLMSLSLPASASARTNQAGAASGSGAATARSGQERQTIRIARSGSQPSRQGPAENFTGSVRVALFVVVMTIAEPCGAIWR
jgi:4-carboxymuconolactone decarboxylase